MDNNAGGVLTKNLIDKLLNAQTTLQNRIYELENENKSLKDTIEGHINTDSLSYKNILKDMLRCASIYSGFNDNFNDYYTEYKVSISDYVPIGTHLDILRKLWEEVKVEQINKLESISTSNYINAKKYIKY